LQLVRPTGGPSLGNTTVKIHAPGLRQLSSQPLCRFDDRAVPASFVQDAAIQCKSPPSPRGQRALHDVALNVAPNGQDYVRRPLRFHYYSLDHVQVNALEPSGGPVHGRTLVVVRGRHLISRGGMHCQFGRLQVQATSLDADTALCRSPALELSPSEETSMQLASVDVRLTLNGDPAAPASQSRTFTYFPSRFPVVTSFYPQAGPRAGGTVVTLSGDFVDLGGVYCAFGDSLPVRAFDLHAQPKCRTPAVPLVDFGVVMAIALRLTVNNDSYGEPCSAHNFTFW